MAGGCLIYKHITISFTPSTPAPANGYVVKWKPVSSGTWVTITPNITASPYTIQYVPMCEDVEVCIQSECPGGVLSTQSCLVAFASGPVLVENTAPSSATINSITPAWFTITSGSFPVAGGSSVNGTHIAFSGSFDVVIANISSGCLILYKNGNVYVSLPVIGPGTYTFSNVSFDTTDDVRLKLQATAC